MKRVDNRIWSLILVLVLVSACTSSKQVSQTEESNESTPLSISQAEEQAFNATGEGEVRIGDEESEYEIIIIDPGFYTWLKSIARPEGYYDQTFLESRNQLYVLNWNQRALGLYNADPNLYLMQINYEPGIDYGYEVNYKLYNYFIYFQRKYKQRLGPFVPRI